jgi:hypothetical protein
VMSMVGDLQVRSATRLVYLHESMTRHEVLLGIHALEKFTLRSCEEPTVP